MNSGNRPRSSEYGGPTNDGNLPVEIAETLWLWEKIDDAPPAVGGATAPGHDQPLRSPDDPARGPEPQGGSSDPIHPTRPPGSAGRVDVGLALRAEPGLGSPGGRVRRYEARTETDPAVADSLAFHRALRPLHLLASSPDRWELDEDATAERLARDELGVPVRRPESEPRYEIHLVVDDSPSMTLWLDVVPGLVNLLEQARLRDVRVSYLDATATRPDGVVLRSSRAAGATPQPATSFNDPSGQRIVWVLSDTLAPAWRSDAMSPALHKWARSGPVALVNLLPERMWHCGGVRFHPVRMVPPRGGAGGTAGRWTFSRPWGRQVAGMSARELARVAPVPMVELSQHWLAPWAAMVGAEPARPTELTAVLAGQVPRPRLTDQSAADSSARERVGRFRHLASPTAFDLATHLAAAPLTWPVLRLVLDMVPAAGRKHLSEVFAAGVI
nr:SAV_2336 N-terminal domain-related protein [Micromonospora sp. DSM 115978]